MDSALHPAPTSHLAAVGPISVPSSPRASPAAGNHRPVLVFFVTVWGILCWRLSAEWSADEQYGYGWFVPVFALVLGLLRWETRPEPAPKSSADGRRLMLTLGLTALAALAPVRLFQEANPDWRVLSWLHAGLVAGCTLLAFQWAGGRPWLRWFVFPVGFFFVAVPWIKGIEEWTVQGMMHGIAAMAAGSLGLLGVPARLEGNLLRVSTGVVGVNEACSGVRSLQTSLMIGLLLGELNRLGVARRVALVAGAATLALAANFLRALILVWIAARHGLAAAERGHDTAGFAILGIVFLGTLALAAGIRPRVRRKHPTTDTDTAIKPPAGRQPGRALPAVWALAALGWLVVVEAGVEGWYRWHERGFVARIPWTARWPPGMSGFREIPVDEHTWRLLRFDEGRAATWRMEGDGAAKPTVAETRCLAYFFRWKPGRNRAVLANAHRPDVCLPATGWQQSADRGVRFYPVRPGLRLPFRHFEFTRAGATGGAMAAHVFYCLYEDRARPANPAAGGATAEEGTGDLGRDPSVASRGERWEAVRDGRRHLGQRVMELALLGPGVPASTEEAEAAFARLLGAGLVISVNSGEG